EKERARDDARATTGGATAASDVDPAASRHGIDSDNPMISRIRDVDSSLIVHLNIMRYAELTGSGTEVSVCRPACACHVIHSDKTVITFVRDVEPALRVHGHALGLIELADTIAVRTE